MGTEHDDNSLLLNCESRSEREKLLAVLVMKHKERLKRMVELRMDVRLHNRMDASDVIQDSYVDVSRRLDEFLARPDVPFFIWLRTLVAQRLITLHRHHFAQMRDPGREVSLHRGMMPQATTEALAAQLLGQFTSPSAAAVRTERKLHMEQALNSMEEGDREILALRHFEHLSSVEAAQVLQIKAPAARQRYVRALRRLKSRLEGLPGFKEYEQHG